MKINRKNAIIVGLSFLGATLFYLLGSGQIDPQLTADNIAASVSEHKTAYMLGIVGEALNIIFVGIIGVLLYRAFKQSNKLVAMSYLLGRAFEAVLLFASLLFAVLVVAAPTGTSDAAQLQGYADNYFMAFNVAMIGLGIGGFILAVELFRRHIGPRWIAVFGVIGYACLAAWAILQTAGNTAPEVLFVPGAVFEIAFPVWLIWKGGKRTTKSQTSKA